MEPSTLFYAGSTTKSFTAAALSLLISKSSEYKDIDWTTPISSIIPEEFVLSDDWATKHITFEDALCHRSGYPRHDKSYGIPEETTASMVRRLRYLPTTAEPRTRWQYQNIMFVAISIAIERLTGEPLKDVLRKQIWEPLGMDSTFFTYEDAVDGIKSAKDGKTSIAKPYTWISHIQLTPLANVSESDHFAEIPYDLPPYISGAGCNITSVLDYCRYLDCMIRQAEALPADMHAELRKQRIPVSESFAKPLSGQSPQTIGPLQYCLGWMYDVYAPQSKNTKGGVEIWQHGGGLNGFSAEMRYIPALELGIVTLGNATPGAHYAGKALVWEIIDNLMGVEEEARFDWKKETLSQEEHGAKQMRGWRERLFGEMASKAGKMTAGLEAHEGCFEHPAYQRMMVKVAHRQSKDKGEAVPYLHVTTALPRAWNFFVELTHVHDEMFMAETLSPYPEGESDSDAGPGQIQDRSRAMFKVDPDGVVQSLGIEMEPALVEKAAKAAKIAGGGKGEVEKHDEHDWDAIEKGMIWFERVSS